MSEALLSPQSAWRHRSEQAERGTEQVAGYRTSRQSARSMNTALCRVGCAIRSQPVKLSANRACPPRRSNGGQPILKPIQMDPEPYSDLGFLVELWGFEPQTSCMPCKRSTN